MQRRRKKRCPNWRGTRNIEIERGVAGFGITISGQKPCIVSAIVKDSPAEIAGVRAGDFLISINGLNVSKLQHEVIVQLINNAHPKKIWMTIADNYYKSDSSDDESCNVSGGRSLLSVDSSQRMRPKYSASKTKGLRSTPQQRIPLHHSNSYEVLMPTGIRESSMFQHQFGYPGTSSALDLPYNLRMDGGMRAAGMRRSHASSDNGDTRDHHSVLIEAGGQVDFAPSLEYKIIVGYLGTIEMPGQLSGPRLQIVRQCIKKMRQEKRQPVAVLMTILPHCMTLRNARNQVLATYEANRMSYVSNGSQSEMERSQLNFGLITTAYYNSDGVQVNHPERTPNVSNSCHVFMVNQKIVDHRVHFEKLSLFKIRCTRDPISNLCLQFPKDTDYVVNLVRSMYTLNVNEDRLMRCAAARNRTAAALDDHSEAAALSNSPQPSNHSELTTTSSNSDSGIGFHNDCSNICDRILVVDFPGLRANNEWPRVNFGNVPNLRPTGIANDQDLCPVLGDGDAAAQFLQELPCSEPENKLTVRAMPFPKRSPLEVPSKTPTRRGGDYEERAVDVPVENQVGDDHKPQEFVFRAPVGPVSNSVTVSKAKQRLNFFSSKLSPKVFLPQRNRIVSKSCENLVAKDSQRRGVPRKLSGEMDQGAETCRDEYIDIWGSVSEVNELDCERLYEEIDLQKRRNLLDGAISEPNINDMAKSLADDLIENCDNVTSSARNSPFRRYGQLSSSFRSQLTAAEQKKMLTSGSGGYGANHTSNGSRLPNRPRSFASSEGDVYVKSNKLQLPPSSTAETVRTTTERKSRDESEKSTTRVLDWNTSIERMLGDVYGVHAFAEFLKMEYSAENIYFWTACERYKQLAIAGERYREAQNIFQRHLEVGAPEPVNVDSRATSKTLEQLNAANPDLFEAAQKQIFNLMKFDSYARFIKSGIYKQCLDAEMKKQPPPYPENRVLEAALFTNLVGPSPNTSPTKLKKSLSNAEDRRRKSLLPWHRKTRSKSKDRNEKEASNNNNDNNIYSSRSSLSSFDAVLSAESADNQRSQLCRVILPNGATTIVQTRATETIRELVERLLEKRGLTYTCFEVIVSGSNKPCDLERMSMEIAGKQVNIEQRVTFKLDLPNKKIISVKSKPEKILGEVLRPILHKYHYSLDEVQVHLRDWTAGEERKTGSLTKLLVTEIDGRRLTILDKFHEEEPQQKSTLHEITNRVFNEIMPDHLENETGSGGVSVKKMADYMNCRFAGQQILKGCHPRTDSTEAESGGVKKPVIAKWTTGVKLLSPTKPSLPVESSNRNGANYKPDECVQRTARTDLKDNCRSDQMHFEVPPFQKMIERPTPAPRLSITRNSLQISTSSINNSQDSGILSNRSVLSTGTSQSETSSSHMVNSNDADNTHEGDNFSLGYDNDNIKSPPPPLPPKPKVLPLKGPNWGGQGSAKNIYLDQPTSSFV